MSYVELDGNISDEAKAMQELARKYGTEVMRPAGLELDKLHTPEEVIAPDSVLWEVHRKYRELGFHKSGLPTHLGGMGDEMDPLASVLISEQMGYADAGLAISLGVSVMPFFLAAMSPEPEMQELVHSYCEDTNADLIGCWAITEPDHGSDWILATEPEFKNPDISPSLKAELVGDEYILNGQKAAWVSNGTIATHASLHLSLDPLLGMQGTGIAVIPLDLPGITKGKPLSKMGQKPLNQGEIFFEEVKIPKKYMIVPDPSAGPGFTQMILISANSGMAVTFSGLAQAAYDEALAYAKERVQGGCTIMQHQNIRLKIFNMFIKVEAARAYVRRMRKYQSANAPGSLAHAIAGKILSTETAFQVASEAIQILGGNGLTTEYPVEKMFRDARASMLEDGANESLAITGASSL